MIRVGLLALALVAVAPLQAQDLDSYGDPLPEDAVFRLGTSRFRQGGKINSIRISPDSKTALTGSTNASVTLWDLETGRRLRTLVEHTSSVFIATYSPDGHRAVSGGLDGNLIVWDLDQGKALATLPAGGVVHDAYFSPDGQTIVASAGEKLQVWNVKSGALDRTNSDAVVRCLALHPDGKSCFTSGEDPTIRQWDLATGKQLHTYSAHDKQVFHVSVSADGKTLASISDDRSIGLWNLETGERIRKIAIPESWPTYVAMMPDGESVLSSSNWSNPGIWNVKTGGRTTEFRDGHRDYVHTAAVSPDGKYVLSGGFDRTLVLWDVKTAQQVHGFEGHQAELTALAYSPDGSVLASVGFDHSLALWDPQSGKRLKASKSLDGRLNAVAFTPDDRLILYGGEGLKIFARDSRSMKKVFAHPTNCVVWFLVVHPDGQVVFANQEVKTFAARELQTGKILRSFEGHKDVVKCLALTPDGKTIASGSYDNSIILWDYETGKPLRTLTGHEDPVFSLAFAAGGKLLLSGSKDKTMILWNVATGEKLHTFEGFGDAVAAIAVSPDGQYVLASSWDRLSILWDLRTYKSIRTLKGHGGSHMACAWSPGGGRFVTGSTDTAALVWDLGLKDDAAAKTWAREWKNFGDARKKETLAPVLADFSNRDYGRWSAARRRLAALEAAGVPVLTDAFPPEAGAEGPDEAALEKLLTALDSDVPAEREKAREELKVQGSAVLPWMDRQLAKTTLSAEVRSGLSSARSGVLEQPTGARDLGRLRAVLLYAELLPSASARQALQRYAKGPEGAAPTLAARRVLQSN